MSGQARITQPRVQTFRLFNQEFYQEPNLLMNMKADLWFRPPPSFLRWKLLECSFQELSSCGLSERCWPEGFSPASPLHLPIAPPQALMGGGQVVVLLKKRSPCSQQPAQSGHFPCSPPGPLWLPPPGRHLQSSLTSSVSVLLRGGRQRSA